MMHGQANIENYKCVVLVKFKINDSYQGQTDMPNFTEDIYISSLKFGIFVWP